MTWTFGRGGQHVQLHPRPTHRGATPDALVGAHRRREPGNQTNGTRSTSRVRLKRVMWMCRPPTRTPRTSARSTCSTTCSRLPGYRRTEDYLSDHEIALLNLARDLMERFLRSRGRRGRRAGRRAIVRGTHRIGRGFGSRPSRIRPRSAGVE